jgi:phenylpropionate dioxygenase-like ring-hydroxylating dioxygenase large terminal subunit
VTGETGSCPEGIVCPYHGWSYGFDGRLRAVPSQGTFPDLDISRMRLPEVEVEEWMGFVFVRFEGEGPGLALSMRRFEDEARPYRLAEMELCGSRTSEIHAFNWKGFVENDSEGYHIPVGHPGLRRLFGSSYSDSGPEGAEGGETARAFAALQETESPVWSERMYQRLLPEVEHLPRDYRRAWIYYAIFPSAVLAIGPESVDCYQVLPVGPEQCRIHGFALALPEESRRLRAARYLKGRINRSVIREDLDYCAWTNEGIRSGRYEGGPLSELEAGVRWFRQRIRDLVPVAGSTRAPGRGTTAELNEQMRAQTR